MKRLAIAIAAFVIIGPAEAGHYQGLGGHYLRAQEESAVTPIILRPTNHPRVPQDVSQFWMAPEKGRVRSAAQAIRMTASGHKADLHCGLCDVCFQG